MGMRSMCRNWKLIVIIRFRDEYFRFITYYKGFSPRRVYPYQFCTIVRLKNVKDASDYTLDVGFDTIYNFTSIKSLILKFLLNYSNTCNVAYKVE